MLFFYVKKSKMAVKYTIKKQYTLLFNCQLTSSLLLSTYLGLSKLSSLRDHGQRFIVDRTKCCAYATVFASVRLSSVTYVLWLKDASYRNCYYWQSYMTNLLVPKWMTLTFV